MNFLWLWIVDKELDGSLSLSGLLLWPCGVLSYARKSFFFTKLNLVWYKIRNMEYVFTQSILSRQDATQEQYSGWVTVDLNSGFSFFQISCRFKPSFVLQFTDSWWKKRCVHAFLKSISSKWNAQPRPGFELGLSRPFPMAITAALRAPPEIWSTQWEENRIPWH